MIFRAFLSVFALGLGTLAAFAAQDHPTSACEFEDFPANPKLAEVAQGKPVVAWYGCAFNNNCLAATLKPGDPVMVYRTEGDWTCGYFSRADGAAPAWILATDIRPINPDPNPPLSAWFGTWEGADTHVTIQKSEDAGKLNLEGDAHWYGLGDVEHTGGFAGIAAPAGNRLHFVEAGADSCTVDLTLLGRFIIASDNERCGGANVRFWGIWKLK